MVYSYLIIKSSNDPYLKKVELGKNKKETLLMKKRAQEGSRWCRMANTKKHEVFLREWRWERSEFKPMHPGGPEKDAG